MFIEGKLQYLLKLKNKCFLWPTSYTSKYLAVLIYGEPHVLLNDLFIVVLFCISTRLEKLKFLWTKN
jgi:hypothetical protein